MGTTSKDLSPYGQVANSVSGFMQIANSAFGNQNIFSILNNMYVSHDCTRILCDATLVNNVLGPQYGESLTRLGNQQVVVLYAIPNADRGLQTLRAIRLNIDSEESEILREDFTQALEITVIRGPATRSSDQLLIFQVMLARCTMLANIRKSVTTLRGGPRNIQSIEMPSKTASEVIWDNFWAPPHDREEISIGEDIIIKQALESHDAALMLYHRYTVLRMELENLHIFLTKQKIKWKRKKEKYTGNNEVMNIHIKIQAPTATGINTELDIKDINPSRLARWLKRSLTDVAKALIGSPIANLRSWWRRNLANKGSVHTFLDTCNSKFMCVHVRPPHDKRGDLAKIVAICQKEHGNHDVYMAGDCYKTTNTKEIEGIRNLIRDRALSTYQITRVGIDIQEFNHGTKELDVFDPKASYVDKRGITKSFSEKVAKLARIDGKCWKMALTDQLPRPDTDDFVLAALEPLLIGSVVRRGASVALVVAKTPQYHYSSEEKYEKDYFRTYHVLKTGIRDCGLLNLDPPYEKWSMVGEPSDMEYFRRKHLTGAWPGHTKLRQYTRKVETQKQKHTTPKSSTSSDSACRIHPYKARATKYLQRFVRFVCK